jgi:hypothetical protein
VFVDAVDFDHCFRGTRKDLSDLLAGGLILGKKPTCA